MTPERYAVVCQLFDETEKLPPSQRHSFLLQRCAGDTALVDAVEEMLRNAPSPDTALFAHTPCPVNIKAVLTVGDESNLIGRRVGPYEIHRQVGSGGMGSVYLAARVGEFEQQVAIKLMRAGLATDELVQRFRTERQVLAGLNHPHIGRLLDGGTTEDGLPYFVMEYIEGVPLDRYCSDHRLDAHGRARLLLKVCEAVAYAHGCTVVHRDLKPGNVLVTTDGAPKVVDFGLAKRLEDGQEGQTASGMILGTPGYMAPEQAAGRPGEIGPLADVWALGAILYELLTGRPPFRADSPLDTIMQVLKEEPVPPSRLHPKLPRDLETITLKCLQKEPRKRYASVEALADDLRRFLDGVPIQARPVGRGERLWRWCRRNPRVAGLLALLVVVIAGSFAAVTSLWLHAQTQRDRAERNFNRVFDAVQESLIRVSDSKELKAPELLAFRKRLLEAARRQFQQFVAELGDDPRARQQLARARLRVGQIHHAMGDRAAAVAEMRQGIELTERLVAEQPRDRAARSLLALGYEWLGVVQPNGTEAAAAFRRSLELREALTADSPERAGTYRSQLAFNYYNAGHHLGSRRADEAMVWLGKARAIREEQARGEPGRAILDHLATIHLLIGAIQARTDRPKEAEASCRRAIEVYERLIRAEPDDGAHRVALADAYQELHLAQGVARKHREGLASLHRACAVLEEFLAREPALGTNLLPYQRALARTTYNLALEHAAHTPQSADADRMFEKTRVLCGKLLAVRPADVELLSWHGISCYNLGVKKLFNPDAMLRLHQEAQTSLEQVARLQPRNLDNHSELGEVLHSVGSLLAARDQRAEAVKLLRRAVEHQRRAHDGDGKKGTFTARLVRHQRILGNVLRDLKRPAEAAGVALERARLCTGNARELCEVAHDLAACVTVIGDAAGSLAEAQQAERQRCADLAIEQLRSAVAAGYRDARRLQEDEVFDPLRDRADFRELLRQVEARAKAKSSRP